jgi:hypothetical protein
MSCHYCNGENYDGDMFEEDGEGGVYQTVRCNDCGGTWAEVYAYDRIEEDYQPDPGELAKAIAKNRKESTDA